MEIFSRRSFLRGCAAGCASAAATGLSLRTRLVRAAALGQAQPLVPQPTHHPAKAKRLVFIFLTGGFSHVDTFDPKPRLKHDHGKIVEGPSLREVAKEPLVASPFEFTPRGRSGLLVSELFPRLGDLADDLCVIRTLHTDILEHFQAALAMHTGSSTVPLPSLGSWLSHGLGTFNPNLPGHVVFCEHLPYGGAQLWDASFLPPIHQGVRVVPGPEPVANLRPQVLGAARDVTLEELERLLLDDLNRSFADSRPGDLDLEARNRSFGTARGMMREAPELFDLSGESDATLGLYGVPRGESRSFAWQCLVARRLIESGVRVVELIDSGASDNWDAHGNMQDHRPKAQRVDRAIAALIEDLKRCGLFADTLVVIATEFGRTPWSPGPGRNHWHRAFSCLLAGAGVRGGIAYGETDDYGIEIVRDAVHVHDYHATILHLLGIDHTRLTYRYAGRDFRLTDVAGNVVQGVLA